MAFSVSSLTDYVNQTSKELLTALHFESETAALANVQVGVKSKMALQILTNTPIPQNGDGCSFLASGTTAFTQREIDAKAVKYQDTLCPRTLEAKWTQILLKNGQKYSEADIPRVIVTDIVAQIKKHQETADWQGDTASANAYLSIYDGLNKIIKAATGTNVATAVSGPVTTSNVRTIMQNVVSKIPVQLKGNAGVKIFCGYDIAELYRQKMFIDNLFHFPVGGNQKNIFAEGSVHEIIPVHGLDGLGSNSGDNPFIFAMDPDRNLFLGVDLLNEEETAEMWYSQDDQNVKYSFRYRRGWQIAFPSEIVEYSNS